MYRGLVGEPNHVNQCLCHYTNSDDEWLQYREPIG